MKKFIALVLSLVMALSLCAPAWGASVDEAALRAVAANGGSVTLDQHITLTETLNIAAGKSVTIDLNGFSISGDYDTVGAYLITVANTGELTVKDSSNPSTGKISHNNLAGPTRVTGDTVYLEGVFNLQSGTIEQNGYWSTSFVVDVHPNAWGADYTAATVFNMSGGKVTNSGQADSCVRLASTSADGGAHPVYKGVSAVFNMTAGEIVAVRDAVFIQQSNSAYDVLDVNISGGTLSGGNSVIRLYGPAPTSFVSGAETPMTLALTGGTYTYTGSGSSYEPVIDGMLVAAGGASAATFVENMDFTVNKAFVEGMSEEFVLIDNGGETYSVYATLAEAVAAAKTGDTITLLGDVELDAAITIPAGVTLTGDKTISVAAGAALGTDSSIIELLGTIDGVKFAVGSFNAVYMYDGAAIKNSTFTGSYDPVSNNITNRGFVTAPGATGITISGNTFTNVRQPGYINDDTVATVSGNTVDGTRGFCVAGADDVTFTGNTFKNTAAWDKDVCDICYFANTKQLTDAEYYAISKANNNCLVEKQNENASNATYQWAGVASVGDVNYDTLQEAVDAVADKGTIVVKFSGLEAVAKAAKTFTVTGNAATIKAGVGFLLSEKDGVYTVTEYVVPPVIEEPEVKEEVNVAAPTVDATINTDKMDETEKEVANKVVEALQTENAVQFNDKANDALSEAATAVAQNEKVEVTAEDVNDLAGTLEQTVTEDEIVVVLQTNFNVKVEDVSVEDGETTVTLDITPVYQYVATTQDVVDSGEEIKVDENAVALGEAKKVTKKITEKVTITIAIPDVLVELAEDNDNTLYVTHKKTNGTKFVYKADVNVTEKTATFENPNGFSTFTISATNSTVAYVEESDMSYATIESAIGDAGKGAVITVMKSDQVVNITAPCSFKLKWADNITEPTFNVAKGYTMSKWYVNGVYTYIVQSASAGGYAPSTTPEKVVTSADTFDAGIALYVGMSVMAAVGSAVVLKKRED